MILGIPLSQLVEGLELERRFDPEGVATGDPEVLGLTHDSRKVGVGDLFVALPGARHDGKAFAAKAADRGAVAILAGEDPPKDLRLAAPWLVVREPRRFLATLASRVHGQPQEHLSLVGVTGTNGKSTVVGLIGALLEASARPTGRIGTLGYSFRDWTEEADRTTPEAPELYRLLRRFRELGAQSAVLEVSSHALELNRVDGLAFDCAVFTNLSRDHLDFHADFESYYAAKRSLFDRRRSGGAAVVNVDDEHGRRMANELAATPPLLTYGEKGDVRPLAVTLDLDGIRGSIATPSGTLEIASRLLGRYNLSNLLAAIAAGVAMGLSPEAMQEGLLAQGPLPGRFERVGEPGAPPVFIDYAHTDDALRAVLGSLKELSDRRIVLVFGAGGERDRGKRPLMGKVAGEMADLPIVTSDNPRGEDPMRILADVEEGVKASKNTSYRLVPDRREAIRRAISVAGEHGVVLVAGKGHETTQEIRGRKLPFSDREEILRALEANFGSATS